VNKSALIPPVVESQKIMQAIPKWKKIVLVWSLLSLQLQPVLAQTTSTSTATTTSTASTATPYTSNPNAGTIGIGPSPIMFANSTVIGGTPLSMQVRVFNKSTSPVSRLTIGITSGAENFSQTNNCQATLAGNQSCTVTIKFSPQFVGGLRGTLFVASDASNGAQSETIYAIASAPNLDISADPVKNTTVGQQSTSKITLKNTSQISVGVTYPTVRAPFSVVDGTCPSGTSTLVGGASCVWTVAFNPTAAGSFNSNFAAQISAGSTTYAKAVTLTGIGLANSATLSDVVFSPTASGQQASAKAILTNTGAGEISIGQVTLKGDAGFTLGNGTCGLTLASGSTCTYSINYSASGAKTNTGTLDVVTSVGTKSASLTALSQKAVLTVSPLLDAFGNVEVGSATISGVHTVTNYGNITAADLLVKSDSGFEITQSSCGTTLAAGSSCGFKVKFAPSVAQDYIGGVTVSGAATFTSIGLTGTGTAPIQSTSATLSAIDFGNVASNSSTIGTATLSNMGAGPLRVGLATVSGSGFALASGGSCATSLAAGSSCSIKVSMLGSGASAMSGLLTLDTGAGSLNAALSGQSQKAIVTVTPVIDSFGSVQVGQSTMSGVHTVTNSGNITATNLIVETQDEGFGVASSTCSSNLTPGASCTFVVKFSPVTAKVYTGGVSVRSASSYTSVGLVGSLAEGGIGVNQSGSLNPVDFGNIAAGTTGSGTTLVKNTGIGPLSLGVATVTGAGFALASGGTCAATLAVGQTCTIMVAMTAVGNSAMTGTLSLATGAGVLTSTLTGQSQQAAVTVAPASDSFGAVQVGQLAVSAVHTVTNASAVAATGLSISTSSVGFSVTSNNCPVSLAAGANCTFTTTFKPIAAQAYSGSVSIASSAPAQTVALSGTGATQSSTLAGIDFGNVAAGTTSTKAATLTNTGAGPLTIGAVTVTGAGFSVGTGGSCAATVAPGASCSLNVVYTASGSNGASGSLSVITSSGTKTANLNGQSQQSTVTVTPTSDTFGSVQIGQSSVSGIHTVTNNGNIAASSLGITTTDAGFAVTNNTCASILAAGASCTFTVTFAPASAQVYAGGVSVKSASSYTAVGVAGSVIQSGTGVSQSATLSDIKFGSLASGTSTTAAATLTNTGIGPLSVGAATVSGTGFAMATGGTCSATLAVGASCVINVTMTGSGTSAQTGALSVVTGAGVKLSALSGQAQQAVITVTPTVDSFGPVQVGQSAVSLVHKVSNSGNVAATNLKITPPAGYSITGSTCSTSLTPAASCSFNVTFSPTADKVFAGGIDLTTDTTYASIGVTGTGVAQAANLTSINFGNLISGTVGNATATLTNTGGGPLGVGAATVAGNGFALASGGTCTATLAVGQACTIKVAMTAAGNSAMAGTLSLTTGAGVLTSALTGQSQQAAVSVTPADDSFGVVQVGQSVVSAVHTVKNTSAVAATGLSVTATGAGFGVTENNCLVSLAAGASCTFTTTFSPVAAQSYSGTVLIASSAPSQTVTLSGAGANQSSALTGIDFGNIAAGSTSTKAATLTNTGTGPVTIGAVTVTGAGFSSGTGGSCATTLAPGASCTLNVTMIGSGTSAANGSLTVVTGAGTKSAALTGQSQQAALTVSPTSDAFGSVQVAQSAVSSVHALTNSGNIPASSLTVVSNDPAFSVTNSTCSTALAVGATCNFKVTFTPTQAIAYTSGVSVTSATSFTTIGVSGTGVAQVGALSSVNFGFVPAGTTVTRPATLTNSGVGPLTVGAPSVTGGGFAVVPGGSCGTLLAAGSSCTLNVSLTASGTTSHSGVLSLPTSAGTKTVALSGVSQQAVLSITPMSDSFGNIQVGQTATSKTHTISNTGNIAATTLKIAPPAGYSIAATTCAATLASAASCTFTLTFAPTAVTSYAGAVLITSNLPAQSITVSGAGVAAAGTLSNIAFGNIASGVTSTGAATLTNTGIGPMTVGTAAVTGVGFALAKGGTCTTTLAPGASCTFAVSMTASGTSQMAGSLSVVTGAGTKTATLTGQSQQTILTVTPTNDAFGSVQVGQTAVSGVHTIKNTGNIPATGLVITAPVGFVITSNSCQASLPAASSCTFAVSFTPAAANLNSGNVSITSNAAQLAVALSGTGVAQSATLSAISFGNVAAGSTTTSKATLTNTGIGPLTVGQVSVAGSGFAVAAGGTCSNSLAAGASCAVNVAMTANAMDAMTGTLSVVTDAGTKTAAITGQSQQALLSVTPTSESFGFVEVGKSVVSVAHTLKNSGNMPVTNLKITSSNPDIVISHTCRTALNPLETCAMSITFAPSAEKSYIEGVSITSDSVFTSIGVSGAGAIAKGTITQNMDFGAIGTASAVEFVATVTNTGVVGFVVGKPSVAAPFSVTKTYCGTLLPSESCTIKLMFASSTAGDFTGSITVPIGSGDITAQLHGKAITPQVEISATNLDYGSITKNTTAVRVVTVKNTGMVDVIFLGTQLKSPVIPGVTTPFNDSNKCAFYALIPPLGSCQIEVSFHPIDTLSYIATLTVATSASSTNVALSGTGVAAALSYPTAIAFGDMGPGSTKTASSTFTNRGVSPITIDTSSISVTGAGFALASGGTCGSVLNQGESCTVNVSLTASGSGDQFGTLYLRTSEGVKSAYLSGRVQQAIVTVSPTTDSLGSIPVGQIVTSGVHTVKNSGNLAATGLNVSSSSQGFSVTNNNCPATLNVGGTCSFTVTFAPTATQSYVGGVSISSGSTYTSIGLTGTGTASTVAATSINGVVTISPPTVTMPPSPTVEINTSLRNTQTTMSLWEASAYYNFKPSLPVSIPVQNSPAVNITKIATAYTGQTAQSVNGNWQLPVYACYITVQGTDPSALVGKTLNFDGVPKFSIKSPGVVNGGEVTYSQNETADACGLIEYPKPYVKTVNLSMTSTQVIAAPTSTQIIVDRAIAGNASGIGWSALWNAGEKYSPSILKLALPGGGDVTIDSILTATPTVPAFPAVLQPNMGWFPPEYPGGFLVPYYCDLFVRGSDVNQLVGKTLHIGSKSMSITRPGKLNSLGGVTYHEVSSCSIMDLSNGSVNTVSF